MVMTVMILLTTQGVEAPWVRVPDCRQFSEIPTRKMAPVGLLGEYHQLAGLPCHVFYICMFTWQQWRWWPPNELPWQTLLGNPKLRTPLTHPVDGTMGTMVRHGAPWGCFAMWITDNHDNCDQDHLHHRIPMETHGVHGSKTFKPLKCISIHKRSDHWSCLKNK